MRYVSSEPHPQDEQHNHRSLRDRGASLVEYALLVALIAVVCIAAITSFGGTNGGSVSRSANSIVTAN